MCVMDGVPEVLFVCTHNAGRSQMAAALLNPAVVQAMAEIGLDISAEFPKPLTTGKVRPPTS